MPSRRQKRGPDAGTDELRDPYGLEPFLRCVDWLSAHPVALWGIGITGFALNVALVVWSLLH